ncbi:hypothetical protein SALBM135S_03053 [Streptomyces alboniger]
MSSVPSEIFASAAPYYARCQPLYPQEFFRSITGRFGLDHTQVALDLGCGPGTIALPLSTLVGQVFAVDPEPGMLEQGRSAAERRARAAVDRQDSGDIQWLRGDSAHVHELNLPTLDLCLMGRSFHWMSRDQVLADLDPLVGEDGGVVIVSMKPPGTEWARVVADVRSRYLTHTCHGVNGAYPEQEEPHEAILARSPFPAVTSHCWTHHVDHTLDDIIGLQLSHSSFTPVRLDDRRDAFEKELREALIDCSPNGHFGQTIHTEALMATRR